MAIENTPAKTKTQLRIEEINEIAISIYANQLASDERTFKNFVVCLQIASNVKVTLQLDEMLKELKAINLNL